MPLSEARAFAVANYLKKLSPVNFPQGRVQVFAHGESQPLVPNNSDANRAKNRRVESCCARRKCCLIRDESLVGSSRVEVS